MTDHYIPPTWDDDEEDDSPVEINIHVTRARLKVRHLILLESIDPAKPNTEVRNVIARFVTATPGAPDYLKRKDALALIDRLDYDQWIDTVKRFIALVKTFQDTIVPPKTAGA